MPRSSSTPIRPPCSRAPSEPFLYENSSEAAPPNQRSDSSVPTPAIRLRRSDSGEPLVDEGVGRLPMPLVFAVEDLVLQRRTGA